MDNESSRCRGDSGDPSRGDVSECGSDSREGGGDTAGDACPDGGAGDRLRCGEAEAPAAAAAGAVLGSRLSIAAVSAHSVLDKTTISGAFHGYKATLCKE